MVVMLTMLPRPRLSIPGTRPATRKYAPRTLVSNIVSNADIPCSTVNADGKLPALLTMMSTSPHCCTSEFTESISAMSVWMNRAFGPMTSTACAPLAGSRPETMTVAPSLANSRADSSPMPAVPPVITAVWSISSIGPPPPAVTRRCWAPARPASRRTGWGRWSPLRPRRERSCARRGPRRNTAHPGRSPRAGHRRSRRTGSG